MANVTINPKDFTIVCKEISKNDGRVAVYDLKMEEIKNNDLTVLSLRSRFNPELSYYVVKKENAEELIKLLSARVNFLKDKVEELSVRL